MANFANYSKDKDKHALSSGAGIQITETTNTEDGGKTIITNTGVIGVKTSGIGKITVSKGDGTNTDLKVVDVTKTLGNITVGNLTTTGSIDASGSISTKNGNPIESASDLITDDGHVIFKGKTPNARIVQTQPQTLCLIPNYTTSPTDMTKSSINIGKINEASWGIAPAYAAEAGSVVTWDLGDNTHRFGTLYTMNSVNTVSDRKAKKNIKGLDERYFHFFMDLVPCSFVFKESVNNKIHVGFIAQDVEEAMQNNDINPDEMSLLFKTKEGNDYIYSLVYDEFIGILSYAMQKLYTNIISLNDRMDRLEGDYGNK